MKVGFIGSGNMASALINGMAKNKQYEIAVMDVNEAALKNVTSKVSYTSLVTEEVIERSDYLVLAIKPYMYQEFLVKYQELLKGKIVISIAAGISSKFMENYVAKYVLVMPNTPAFLGLGMTSVVKNDCLSNIEFENILGIFKAVGEVEIIAEKEMEALICLAGSAPAYFYLVLEAMAKFGETKGIDKEKATMVAANVMRATAQMQLESDLNPRVLADKVCSPNGTTIKAVDYFDDHNLEEIFFEAMEACYQRAIEMKSENDESL